MARQATSAPVNQQMRRSQWVLTIQQLHAFLRVQRLTVLRCLGFDNGATKTTQRYCDFWSTDRAIQACLPGAADERLPERTREHSARQ